MIIALLGVLLCTSCRKSAPITPDELDQMISENFCKSIIEDSNMVRDIRLRAKKVLIQRQNETMDAEPVLVLAALSRLNSGLLIIVLGFSDEDGDVAGITIREESEVSNSENNLLVESYPAWGHTEVKAATYYFTPIHIRENDERKDEDAWKAYLEGGDWTPKKQPPLWISLPREGKVSVQVCVYDHVGNVSNYVEVENFIEPNENTE